MTAANIAPVFMLSYDGVQRPSSLLAGIAGVLLTVGSFVAVLLMYHGIVNGLLKGHLLVSVNTKRTLDGARARAVGLAYACFGGLLLLGGLLGIIMLLRDRLTSG
jgi:hypothetical protein